MVSLVKVFSEHLLEFYDELIKLYPSNNELKAGRTIVETFKRFNAKKLLEGWNTMILKPYEKEIMEGNLGFFMNHNFNEELGWGNCDRKTNEDWMKEIKLLVKNMKEDNLKKSIKYFQNLTKICKLYYNQK